MSRAPGCRPPCASAFRFAWRHPLSCDIPGNLLAWAKREGADITIYRDPLAAAQDARAIVTDCWVSMADDPARNVSASLAPFRVTGAVMAQAAPDALFMHCLPAHRGEEVEAGVIDGPQSVVFDEAENRLHAQKGVLAWALGGAGVAKLMP